MRIPLPAIQDYVPASSRSVHPEMALQLGNRLLTAQLVSSTPDAIAELAESIRELAWGEEFGSDPSLYIASVWQRNWVPRLVAVRENGKLVGLVYSTERKIGAFNSGLLLADGSLIPTIFSDPGNRDIVLCAAFQYLFSYLGIRGIRMLISSEAAEMSAVHDACKTLSCLDSDIFHSSNASISHLPLPASYEAFLAALGLNSRRNFRRYRHRFEARNNRYVEQIPYEEFVQAVACLAQKCKAGGTPSVLLNPETLHCGLRVLAVAPRTLLAGLRSPDGQWLAVLGAWYGGQSATMVLQLNDDSGYPHDSLSVVLRSYVIETLIAQGVQDVVFRGGLSVPLVRHCRTVPVNEVHLDSRALLWRLFRYGMAKLISRFRQNGSIWIAPPAAGRLGPNLQLAKRFQNRAA